MLGWIVWTLYWLQNVDGLWMSMLLVWSISLLCVCSNRTNFWYCLQAIGLALFHCQQHIMLHCHYCITSDIAGGSVTTLICSTRSPSQYIALIYTRPAGVLHCWTNCVELTSWWSQGRGRGYSPTVTEDTLFWTVLVCPGHQRFLRQCAQ